MSYFNLKFIVDFLGHVKNVKINILFFTVYIYLCSLQLTRVHVISTCLYSDHEFRRHCSIEEDVSICFAHFVV